MNVTRLTQRSVKFGPLGLDVSCAHTLYKPADGTRSEFTTVPAARGRRRHD